MSLIIIYLQIFVNYKLGMLDGNVVQLTQRHPPMTLHFTVEK